MIYGNDIIQFLNATELTISSDAITITQGNHKLQPQSGTADNLSTISGTSQGQFGILYVTDFGTDTITIKHNVGNILCTGSVDIALSHGCVMWYSDGVKVHVAGGGGGSFSPTITSPALGHLVFYDGTTWRNIPGLRDGTMLNGKLSVTVSSNDLVVALKTEAGTDASSTNPIIVKIGGTLRLITAALSITIPDGTNWFNAGSAELGTKLVPYFPYLVWDSNSSVIALTISRIPYANVVSNFHTTTTNEKHCYNFSNFTSTDDVVNIGYFEATLSLAGTSHLWTVPTFTSDNFKSVPTFESRIMDFVSTITPQAGSLSSIVRLEKYQVTGRSFIFDIGDNFTINTSAPAYIQFTLPWSPSTPPSFSGVISDTAVTSSNVTSSGNSLFVRRYDGAGFTVGAGRDVRIRYNGSLP